MEDFKLPGYIPENSELEEDVNERFNGMEINSEAELDIAIKSVFQEICGTNGEAEFFGDILPVIKKIYGSNYRKAGLKLLGIIDAGAEKPVKEIGSYFKSAAEKEGKFLNVNKREKLENILKKIEEVILQKKEKYGESYDGVIAVLVYGSYANNTFNANSDLDVLYITSSAESGFVWKEYDQYINYASDFDSTLSHKLRIETDNFYHAESMQNPEVLKRIVFGSGDVVVGDYVIACPYPQIKEKIEEILNSGH